MIVWIELPSLGPSHTPPNLLVNSSVRVRVKISLWYEELLNSLGLPQQKRTTHWRYEELLNSLGLPPHWIWTIQQYEELLNSLGLPLLWMLMLTP